MKILMLGWELPPHNSGGLGVACFQLCKHLARTGALIDFVLPYTADHKLDFMKVHSTSPLQPHEIAGAYQNDISVIRAQQQAYISFVEQLATKTSYDVVHAHDWLTFEAGLRAKELAGKPLVAHVHATEYDRAGLQRGNELVHQIEQSALMHADAIVTVSQATKELLAREYHIPRHKIQVVHNALDTSNLTAADSANAYHYLTQMKALGYKVVVSLGRLSLQKGIDHLLAAAERVLKQNNKILFLIVGDGEERPALLTAAAKRGIASNVIFAGFQRGKRWRDAFAVGDMFVMPSVSEPFGLSALEAASYHNAILLSKQCGVGEVLHNTMQFDFWDTQKLANAILTVAEHGALRTLLADSAQQEVATLTWETVVSKFNTLYKQTEAAL